jgi:hypothetical protein
MEYIVIVNFNQVDNYILTDYHGFIEVFASYEDAVEAGNAADGINYQIFQTGLD